MREYTTPNVSHGLILFINGAPRSTIGRTGDFVDEISARPAAAKALTLKDELAWNSAMDEEAHANMCKHLKVASSGVCFLRTYCGRIANAAKIPWGVDSDQV